MLKRLSVALAMSICAIAATTQAMEIATNFWDINWVGRDEVFKDNMDVSGDNPWNPTFLEEIDFYTMLRFMDWDRTNKSPRTEWSQRRLKSSKIQNGPVAYEWMIDLCNRTNSDMWVCIPHRTVTEADSARPCDYALRLAILIKTGVDMQKVSLTPLHDQLSSMSAAQLVTAGGVKTCEPLKSGQKVYFEYSNEIWNTQFKGEKDSMDGQFVYCAAKGRKANIVRTNVWYDNVSIAQGYAAWASIRVFRAVELVFGEKSPRVVKIMPQCSSTKVKTYSPHIKVYREAILNRWQIRPDAIAIAPYFGNGLDGGLSTVWDVLWGTTELSMQQSIDETRGYASSAKTEGLKLVAYEGGQHLLNNPSKINYDPKMYTLYTAYLDSLSNYMSVFAHYVHQGGCGESNCWGAKKKIGDPMSGAPKLKALYDWAKKNPVSNSIQPALKPAARALATKLTNAQAFDLHGRRIDGSTQSATRLMLLRDEFGRVSPHLSGTLIRK